jgi:hypothetical protein
LNTHAELSLWLLPHTIDNLTVAIRSSPLAQTYITSTARQRYSSRAGFNTTNQLILFFAFQKKFNFATLFVQGHSTIATVELEKGVVLDDFNNNV